MLSLLRVYVYIYEGYYNLGLVSMYKKQFE